MKSPTKSRSVQSQPQSKQLPIPSHVSSFQVKHKSMQRNNCACIKSSDTDLQSTDKRRNYMRRGSKTPMMLLLDASLDMELLGRSILPGLDVYDKHNTIDLSNISYSALNTTALSLAAAIDILPDPMIANSRMRRTSNSWKIDGSNNIIQPSMNTTPLRNYIPPERTEYDVCGDHTLNQKRSPTIIQPRSLTAVTAIQEYLEKVSIGNNKQYQRNPVFTPNPDLPMKNYIEENCNSVLDLADA